MLPFPLAEIMDQKFEQVVEILAGRFERLDGRLEVRLGLGVGVAVLFLETAALRGSRARSGISVRCGTRSALATRPRDHESNPAP